MVPPTRFAVVADGPATSRPIKLMGIDSVLRFMHPLDNALSWITGRLKLCGSREPDPLIIGRRRRLWQPQPIPPSERAAADAFNATRIRGRVPQLARSALRVGRRALRPTWDAVGEPV